MVNLIKVLQFVFDDLQHLLIRLMRGLTYFHDVELVYPSDEFQTSWIFDTHTQNAHNPWYRVANTGLGTGILRSLRMGLERESSNSFPAV